MPRIHPESKTHFHLFAGPLEQIVRSGIKGSLEKVLISKTHTEYTLFKQQAVGSSLSRRCAILRLVLCELYASIFPPECPLGEPWI